MVPSLQKQNLKHDEVKKVAQNHSVVGPELGFVPRQSGSGVYALNGHALLNCRNRISMPANDQKGQTRRQEELLGIPGVRNKRTMIQDKEREHTVLHTELVLFERSAFKCFHLSLPRMNAELLVVWGRVGMFSELASLQPHQVQTYVKSQKCSI